MSAPSAISASPPCVAGRVSEPVSASSTGALSFGIATGLLTAGTNTAGTNSDFDGIKGALAETTPAAGTDGTKTDVGTGTATNGGAGAGGGGAVGGGAVGGGGGATGAGAQRSVIWAENAGAISAVSAGLDESMTAMSTA